MTIDMPPLDMRAKQLMREFLRDKIEADKKQMGMYRGSGGFTVREVDLERFLDDMWVYINKRLLEQNETQE